MHCRAEEKRMWSTDVSQIPNQAFVLSVCPFVYMAKSQCNAIVYICYKLPCEQVWRLTAIMLHTVWRCMRVYKNDNFSKNVIFQDGIVLWDNQKKSLIYISYSLNLYALELLAVLPMSKIMIYFLIYTITQDYAKTQNL